MPKRPFSERTCWGTYTTGRRLIQTPIRGLSDGNLISALAHELGHAETERQGVFDQSFQGHGFSWMRIMIEAGLGQEAERTTAFRPGALQALRTAQEQVHNLQRAGRTIPGNADDRYAGTTKWRSGYRCVAQVQIVVNHGDQQWLETLEIPGCRPS